MLKVNGESFVCSAPILHAGIPSICYGNLERCVWISGNNKPIKYYATSYRKTFANRYTIALAATYIEIETKTKKIDCNENETENPKIPFTYFGFRN